MKDIYQLLNGIEDEFVSLKDLNRVELTENEKKRISNYVLVRSQSTSSESEGVSGQSKRIRPMRRGVVIAVLVLCIFIGCISVGAAVFHYINGNTVEDYKEEPSEEVKVREGSEIDGVDIRITDISRVHNDVTFEVEFTFQGDTSERYRDMEQWAVKEGRSILGNEMFEASRVYFDNHCISTVDHMPDAFRGAMECDKNVVMDGQKMTMEIYVTMDSSIVDEDHQVVLHFEDLDMGSYIAEGVWECEYEIKANKYEEELVKVDLEEPLTVKTPDTSLTEELEIMQYAVTPNGLRLFGTMALSSNWECDSFYSYGLRVLVWDDLGNYYLMYPRTTGLISGDENNIYDTDVYQAEFTLYDDQVLIDTQEEKNLADVSYQNVWDPNASALTFAIEMETDFWDETGKEFYGTQTEVVSDQVTVKLKD